MSRRLDGRGGFALRQEIATGIGATGIHAADFNGDGRVDLAVADGQGDEVAVIRSDGSGGFHAPWVAELQAPRREATAAALLADATAYEGVAGLTLDPPIIDGGTGGTALGTVTLNAPAPAVGVVVTLGSSNVGLAATLPSITIPAGATQGALCRHDQRVVPAFQRAGVERHHLGYSRRHRERDTGHDGASRPADFNSGVAVVQ